jgi:hypothetical protein
MLAVAVGVLAAPAPASAQAPGPILKQQLIFTAHPDRCFSEVGALNPVRSPGQTSCPRGSRLNVRDEYAWGAASVGNFAYVRSGPNAVCSINLVLNTTGPWQSRDNVCEGRFGSYAAQ